MGEGCTSDKCGISLSDILFPDYKRQAFISQIFYVTFSTNDLNKTRHIFPFVVISKVKVGMTFIFVQLFHLFMIPFMFVLGYC